MLDNIFGRRATIEISQPAIAESKKEYTDIRPQWKALAQNKSIKSEDMAALIIYRYMIRSKLFIDKTPLSHEELIKQLHRSFTPITNSNKLNNGAQPYWALQRAIINICDSSLRKWLSEDEFNEIITIIRSLRGAYK